MIEIPGQRLDPKALMAAVQARVKANQAVLDGCAKPHDFSQREDPKPFSKVKCSKCGGLVDLQCAAWYKRGQEDGKAKAP